VSIYIYRGLQIYRYIKLSIIRFIYRYKEGCKIHNLIIYLFPYKYLLSFCENKKKTKQVDQSLTLSGWSQGVIHAYTLQCLEISSFKLESLSNIRNVGCSFHVYIFVTTRVWKTSQLGRGNLLEGWRICVITLASRKIYVSTI
jgi:hypothetical protein